MSPLGYTGKVTVVAPGIEVRERAARVAYARNGNVGRATVYKAWDVYRDGTLFDRGLKFRDAMRLARSLAAGNIE